MGDLLISPLIAPILFLILFQFLPRGVMEVFDVHLSVGSRRVRSLQHSFTGSHNHTKHKHTWPRVVLRWVTS